MDLLKHESMPQSIVCPCESFVSVIQRPADPETINIAINIDDSRPMEHPVEKPTHRHLHLRALSIPGKTNITKSLEQQKYLPVPLLARDSRGGDHVNLPESSRHMKKAQPPDQSDTKANTPAIIQLFLQIYLY